MNKSVFGRLGKAHTFHEVKVNIIPYGTGYSFLKTLEDKNFNCPAVPDLRTDRKKES